MKYEQISNKQQGDIVMFKKFKSIENNQNLKAAMHVFVYVQSTIFLQTMRFV